MSDVFAMSLAFVLHQEGGWSDRSDDTPTMQGITLATYSAWLGRQATKAELRAIPDLQVAVIYRERYWQPPKCGEMPPALGFVTFDTAVNMGPSTAAKLLQRTVGVADDGKVGPITLAACWGAELRPALAELIALRGYRYGSLSTFSTFGKGWMRRLAACHDAALTLA